MSLSVTSKINEIYRNEQGRAVLEKYMPKLTRTPAFQMTCCMSFAAVSRFRQWRLSPQRLAEAAAELERIDT